MAKSKKTEDMEQKIGELTQDLQRTRADFENYRKRVEQEKLAAREFGQTSSITKLLPVVDDIERAIAYIPEELKGNKWAKGVSGLTKKLDKSLENLNVVRIDSSVGSVFDPEMHEAIQFDEDAEGESEVIAEELQAGYMLNGSPIRHAMVKVTRR